MKFEAVSYSSGIQLSWSVLDTPFQIILAFSTIWNDKNWRTVFITSLSSKNVTDLIQTSIQASQRES